MCQRVRGKIIQAREIPANWLRKKSLCLFKRDISLPNQRKRGLMVRIKGEYCKKPQILSVARLKVKVSDLSCSPTPSAPPLHPVHPFFSASFWHSSISLPQGQRGVSVISHTHTHTVCTSTHMYVTHVRTFFNDSQRESTVNPLPFMD